MKAGTHSVLSTSENLGHAKGSYDKYSDKIRRAQVLVDEIIKAEKWDEMKLRYSFYFFLFTVAYIILKRFFLWEFLYAIYYIAFIVGQYLLMPILSLGTS